MKAVLISVAFAAMTVADLASGPRMGDARMIAGPGTMEPAHDTDAAAPDVDPDDAADRAPDGTGLPAGAQGEDDPEVDHAAGGDDVAIAAAVHMHLAGRRGDDGVPSAQRATGHARAPPAPVPATRTDREA